MNKHSRLTLWLCYLVVLVLANSIPASEVTAHSERARKASMPRVDYVLQPLDVLKVQVFQEEDINKLGEVRITQEHTISLPMIGTLNIKGMTTTQVRDLVRTRYDRDYLVDPQVQVHVLEYSKRFVNVVGQVNKPGEIQIPPEQGLTLLEAISRAGGHTRLARLAKVVLKRTHLDGTTETFSIDVDTLMKGEGGEVWPLEPGDHVTVAEKII